MIRSFWYTLFQFFRLRTWFLTNLTEYVKKNVNWIKFKSVFIENSNEFKIIQWFLAKNQILVNIFLVMQTTNQTEGCCCLFSKFHHLNGTHFIIAEHIYHVFIWKTQELAQLINCTSFFTYSYQYLPRSLSSKL